MFHSSSEKLDYLVETYLLFTYVEVLDGSRIHPEAYDWAKKMAVDALEMDEDEGNPANALEEILQGPAKLHELNLEAFAQELERQGLGKKLVRFHRS